MKKPNSGSPTDEFQNDEFGEVMRKFLDEFYLLQTTNEIKSLLRTSERISRALDRGIGAGKESVRHHRRSFYSCLAGVFLAAASLYLFVDQLLLVFFSICLLVFNIPGAIDSLRRYRMNQANINLLKNYRELLNDHQSVAEQLLAAPEKIDQFKLLGTLLGGNRLSEPDK